MSVDDSKLLVLTVGYSTHPWETFLALLKQHAVTAIADVRSSPVSWQPIYNSEPLAVALKSAGIAYVFLGKELGARRPEPECYEAGRVVYEKVAQIPLFIAGLDRVCAGLTRHRIALMCAEKEPLDCHRTLLISRQLRLRDVAVQHILGDGTLEDHQVTERRIVKQANVHRTLFEPQLSDAELLARAYEVRGRACAYHAEDVERMKAEG